MNKKNIIIISFIVIIILLVIGLPLYFFVYKKSSSNDLSNINVLCNIFKNNELYFNELNLCNETITTINALQKANQYISRLSSINDEIKGLAINSNLYLTSAINNVKYVPTYSLAYVDSLNTDSIIQTAYNHINSYNNYIINETTNNIITILTDLTNEAITFIKINITNFDTSTLSNNLNTILTNINANKNIISSALISVKKL